MTVYITGVHMEPSNAGDHEHIAGVRWEDTGNNTNNQCSRQQMVDWINGGNVAWVRDGQGSVQVRVIDGYPPYLRTVADGRQTDNLLSLPRY